LEMTARGLIRRFVSTGLERELWQATVLAKISTTMVALCCTEQNCSVSRKTIVAIASAITEVQCEFRAPCVAVSGISDLLTLLTTSIYSRTQGVETCLHSLRGLIDDAGTGTKLSIPQSLATQLAILQTRLQEPLRLLHPRQQRDIINLLGELGATKTETFQKESLQLLQDFALQLAKGQNTQAYHLLTILNICAGLSDVGPRAHLAVIDRFVAYLEGHGDDACDTLAIIGASIDSVCGVSPLGIRQTIATVLTTAGPEQIEQSVRAKETIFNFVDRVSTHQSHQATALARITRKCATVGQTDPVQQLRILTSALTGVLMNSTTVPRGLQQIRSAGGDALLGISHELSLAHDVGVKTRRMVTTARVALDCLHDTLRGLVAIGSNDDPAPNPTTLSDLFTQLSFMCVKESFTPDKKQPIVKLLGYDDIDGGADVIIGHFLTMAKDRVDGMKLHLENIVTSVTLPTAAPMYHMALLESIATDDGPGTVKDLVSEAFRCICSEGDAAQADSISEKVLAMKATIQQQTKAQADVLVKLFGILGQPKKQPGHSALWTNDLDALQSMCDEGFAFSEEQDKTIEQVLGTESTFGMTARGLIRRFVTTALERELWQATMLANISRLSIDELSNASPQTPVSLKALVSVVERYLLLSAPLPNSFHHIQLLRCVVEAYGFICDQDAFGLGACVPSVGNSTWVRQLQEMADLLTTVVHIYSNPDVSVDEDLEKRRSCVASLLAPVVDACVFTSSHQPDPLSQLELVKVQIASLRSTGVDPELSSAEIALAVHEAMQVVCRTAETMSVEHLSVPQQVRRMEQKVGAMTVVLEAEANVIDCCLDTLIDIIRTPVQDPVKRLEVLLSSFPALSQVDLENVEEVLQGFPPDLQPSIILSRTIQDVLPDLRGTPSFSAALAGATTAVLAPTRVATAAAMPAADVE
jgi:hypothetical protein